MVYVTSSIVADFSIIMTLRCSLRYADQRRVGNGPVIVPGDSCLTVEATISEDHDRPLPISNPLKWLNNAISASSILSWRSSRTEIGSVAAQKARIFGNIQERKRELLSPTTNDKIKTTSNQSKTIKTGKGQKKARSRERNILINLEPMSNRPTETEEPPDVVVIAIGVRWNDVPKEIVEEHVMHEVVQTVLFDVSPYHWSLTFNLVILSSYYQKSSFDIPPRASWWR